MAQQYESTVLKDAAFTFIAKNSQQLLQNQKQKFNEFFKNNPTLGNELCVYYSNRHSTSSHPTPYPKPFNSSNSSSNSSNNNIQFSYSSSSSPYIARHLNLYQAPRPDTNTRNMPNPGGLRRSLHLLNGDDNNENDMTDLMSSRRDDD